MHSKMVTKKPFILILYGYPGSGKSTFARLFADEIADTIHLHADKIQAELTKELGNLGGNPDLVQQKIIGYLTREFLSSNMNVILDIPVYKKSDRRKINRSAKELNAALVTVWLQIDLESAFERLRKRDKRKVNDRYARDYTRTEYDAIVNTSQNPNGEDYVVISGKHTFNTQRAAVFKKMEELKILSQTQTVHKKIKPELVNLVPNRRGKDDLRRRDISVR